MIAFLADLHFGSRNNHLPTFNSQMLFYEKQFFPYLLENKIKDVIIAGDVFDVRSSVGIQILQELRYRFFGWFMRNHINCHWILGNHDVVANSTLEWNIARASGLDDYDHIKVYSEPTRVEIDKYTFGFVPWVIGNLVIPDKIDLCVGHFDIKSFYVTKGIESKSGFSISDFKKYKLVLSGHYHIADRKDNIQYLGNPYQKDFGDLNLSKGFWILDNEFNLTQYENLVSPRHLNLVYNETETGFEVRSYGLGMNDVIVNDIKKIDILTNLCQNNYTKMIVNSGSDEKRIQKIYSTLVEFSGEGYTPELINITEMISNVDKEKMESTIGEDSDVIGNMRLYTESVTLKDDIDKELLVEMFEEIYKTTVIESI